MSNGAYVGRGTNSKAGRPLVPYVLGDTRYPGVGPSATTLPAITSYLHTLVDPGVHDYDGAMILCTPVEAADMTKLRFFGRMSDASDPNNKTASIRIWMQRELRVGFGAQEAVERIGRYIGELALTVGNTACATGSKIIPPNSKWVDTIAITTDATLSPGIRVTGDETDCCAMAAWDKESDSFLIVALAGDGASPAVQIGCILEQV